MSEENNNYDKELAKSICRLYSTVKKLAEHESELNKKNNFDESILKRRIILTSQEENLLVNLLEEVDENIRK